MNPSTNPADRADHGAAQQAQAITATSGMMFGVVPKKRQVGEERDLQDDRDDHDQRDPQRDAPGDDHPPTPGRLGPAGRDLHDVEVPHVGERSDVHALGRLLLPHGRVLDLADGDVRRDAHEESEPLLHPAVATIWPWWIGSLLSMKSSSSVLGSPASGSATP